MTLYKVLKKLAKTSIKWLSGTKTTIALMRFCGYQVGDHVYIGEDLVIAEDPLESRGNLIIGDRVALAPRVTLVLASGPTERRTQSRLAALGYETIRGRIVIEDDVWIGAGAVILPNVTVHTCSIVAANAVVVDDVPPFSLVAGVPAKVIKRISTHDPATP